MKNPLKQLIALAVFSLVSLLPIQAFCQVERHEIPLENAVFLGPADAPVTIIEFLDFQ